MKLLSNFLMCALIFAVMIDFYSISAVVLGFSLKKIVDI